MGDLVDAEEIPSERLFPAVGKLREINAEVAAALGMVAWGYGIVRREIPEAIFINSERLMEFIAAHLM